MPADDATGYVAPTESTYTTPPVPDEEAVIVSLTTATAFSDPVVTIVDHTGVELECVLPCTVRTRVGRVAFHGARLHTAVDLDPAGLTYDVALTEGPNGDDIAWGVGLTLSGGLALGLSIWGLASVPYIGDELTGLCVIGAVYGGIAFLIALPFTIATLAGVDGSSSLTGFRVGLTSRVELTGSGVRVVF